MSAIKCGACKEVVKSTEKVVCNHATCSRTFHCQCVGITSRTSRKLTTWVCPACTSKLPKSGDNSTTPDKEVAGSGTSVSSISSTRKPSPTPPPTESTQSQVDSLSHPDTLLTIRNALKIELNPMQSQISTLESTLNYFSSKYDDLLKELKSTTTELKKQKEENSRLRNALEDHDRRIQRLEEENAVQQQWNRLQNVEIVGVPETKDEDTTALVVQLADKIGVTVDTTEIEFAHRVQPRRPSSAAEGRTIIARLRHRRTKDAIVAASRKQRGLKPSSIGISGNANNDRNIYVNEHLTKHNRSLIKECKIRAKETNYKFVWTKNCRIYVRRDESSPPIPIITSADFVKLS